jgi:hypothetical protein
MICAAWIEAVEQNMYIERSMDLQTINPTLAPTMQYHAAPGQFIRINHINLLVDSEA